jgi:hypothetical protein
MNAVVDIGYANYAKEELMIIHYKLKRIYLSVAIRQIDFSEIS